MFGSSNVINPVPDVAGINCAIIIFTASGELASTFHVTGDGSKVPEGGSLFTIAADYAPIRARSCIESSLIDARDNFAAELRRSIATSPILVP